MVINGLPIAIISDGFGNVHTINTWWNGYEIDNLASFDFILLPIELMEWKAE
jgi:hypothetical protein